MTPEPSILVAHFGGETKTAAVVIATQLRTAGIGTRLAFARNRRSMKSQMREANRHRVHYAVILGEDEIAQNSVYSTQHVDRRANRRTAGKSSRLA